MAFFPSRKGGDDSAATNRQPESIEAIRRRAKHRLIGACVLVLVGVIGFPLLFDTQPRPISVDIPIEIPDRSKTKPLPAPAAPAAPVTQAPAPSQHAQTGGAVTQAPAPSASVVAKAEPAPPAAKAEPAPAPKPEPKPAAPAPAAKPDDGAKAMALLEGKPVANTSPAAPAAEGRFVVQVGAFSDAAKVRETRRKLEQAGLKTFAQEVETKDGKRTRVRIGPFTSRAEADKAAEKVKGLDLPGHVLTL